MRLIVGLGNPGEEYKWTRHNLGFMLIDKLAAETEVTVKRRECRSLIGSAVIEDERVRLVKPQTFMNLSGEAVACLLAKEKVEDASQDLIVISDDLALPFGTIRLRERGSAGGHNGLKSIINTIGTSEFIRLRVGIRPDHPVNDAKAFVLEDFRKAQRDEVEKVLDKAAEAVHTVLRDGIKKAMSVFN
jgi:PTH1 family peptidyl-tRNA hydrolase